VNILYFGSGAFGLPTLESIAREHTIAAIVTQPARPAGRRRTMTPTPVAAWAHEHTPDAPVLTPERVNEPGVADTIRSIHADAWVVIAYGQKLGRALLADRFAVNLHASLLPRWRGAAPINHAILAGDTQTGVSVITLADRMDAGDVLAQARIGIEPSMTAGELHDRLATLGAPVIGRTLEDLARGSLNPAPQDESLVTLAPKLSRADSWVDIRRCAEACRRRVHGLTPWPGVSVQIGDERVRLLRVEQAPAESDQPPGTLIEPTRGVVACGGGTRLRLLEVQPAGGRAMAWADFARGRTMPQGLIIRSEAPC